MKLRELKALLDETAQKNRLDPEKTFVAFRTGCTVGGSTSYIPSEYVNGTRDDPPSAFAKEYDFERDVEVEFSAYAIDKKGGKCLIYVGDFDDFDSELDFDVGIEFDGALSSHERKYGNGGHADMYGFDTAAEKLKLTGDEEVELCYAGKTYRYDAKAKDVASVEKRRFGLYDCVWLNLPFEPSDAWKAHKAEQLADEIDPEDEIEQDYADYKERQADAERDER